MPGAQRLELVQEKAVPLGAHAEEDVAVPPREVPAWPARERIDIMPAMPLPPAMHSRCLREAGAERRVAQRPEDPEALPVDPVPEEPARSPPRRASSSPRTTGAARRSKLTIE